MKEFLFSRSHKKHYSSAVVRMGKNNLGFSLVELIIVIAIMAILAAVAIPVLGVFIEKAEINNDKQAVSDIIYAIDLANKSGAFAEDNSMTLGTTKYPVAFIIINENGTEVITSNTTVNEVEGQCNFQDVSVYYAKPLSKTITCDGKKLLGGTCGKSLTGNIYTIETATLNICTSHSKKTTGSVTYAASLKAEHSVISCKAVKASDTESIPANSYVTTSLTDTNGQGLYQQTGNGKCAMAAYGTLGTPSIASDDVNSAVYQAIAAVYGDSFTEDLKLSYDEWMVDGNMNYSTFYTTAPQVFQEVQSLGNLLVIACLGGNTAKEALGLSKVYKSTSDIMDTFAGAFSTTYPVYSVPENDANAAKDWESVWRSVPNQGQNYGFGISGRENYSACRIGFNTAFGSYLEVLGETEYASVVKNFFTQSMLGVELPGVVTISAFKNGTEWDESKDVATKVPTDTKTLGKQLGSLEAINEVYGYYIDYINSDTFIENGKAFHNTIVTVKDTSTTANIYADGDSEDYFAFYQTYLNEISSLYKEAQARAGSDGIMIIVYVENGVASCEVTPSAADPRKK